MKKLMTIAAAALCASVFADGIQSANVVGYQNDTLDQNKFVIKAIQFEDTESGKVKVNKVFTGFENLGVDYGDGRAFKLTAPRILVQAEAGGYTTYYYLNDAAIDAKTFVKGWADLNGDYKDLEVTPGISIWVIVPGDNAATVASGAVADEASVSIAAKAGNFTLVGSPFPTSFTLNSDKVTFPGINNTVEYGDGRAFKLAAPRILVQAAAGGYDTYYYLKDAAVDAKTFVEGWADLNGDYVKPQIKAGTGFWVLSAEGMTVQFSL